MSDDLWRTILRWAFLFSLIVVPVGVGCGVYLLFRVHRAHAKTIDLLIAWARERTGHFVDVPRQIPPDDQTMGLDFGLGALGWRLYKRVRP